VIRAVEWNSGAIVAVDQTVLPAQLRRVYLTTLDEVVDAVQWSGALQSSGSPGRSGSRSPRGLIGATTTP
jgi:methylthioribose-1-phosphate isomerase